MTAATWSRTESDRATPAPIGDISEPMRAAMIAMLYDVLLKMPRGYIASKERHRRDTTVHNLETLAALDRRGICTPSSHNMRPCMRLTAPRGRWYAVTALACRGDQLAGNRAN